MIDRARQEGWKIGLCAVMTLVTIHRAEAVSGQHVLMPERSAGVFIGVEKFSHDSSLSNVVYAVNDAIDLAYSFSIERGILPPTRVLLLLAGEPSGESRSRLTLLVKKGATRESAKQADIYSLVLVQSRLVEPRGIFILSIATHGYANGAEHLLLAEDSLIQFQTGVTAEKLLQATQTEPGSLRLLFVDACRKQLERGGSENTRSAMPAKVFETLATSSGYVVFSAASIGKFAFPGTANGLFTGALVDGLRCGGLDQGESLQLAKLFSFVTEEVDKRSARRQRPELRHEGGQVDLVLPPCSHQREPISKPIPSAVLQMIQDAASYASVGGPDNFEKSFRLYRQAFQELPLNILASLNQGQVARARKLEKDSQRAEGVRIYGQLLLPLLAQSRTHRDQGSMEQ